jgi:hypothetical protein
MGDSRRFSQFAEVIANNWPASHFVADVAGGKGLLQAALRRRSFTNIVSWDKRHKYAKGNRARMYRYGLFDYRSAPRDYDLVVGMHPDQGTDHIVSYAVKHRKPFAVCPCCVLPSAQPYGGTAGYAQWCDHLIRMAESARFDVNVTLLPMTGRNVVIVGRPLKRMALMCLSA